MSAMDYTYWLPGAGGWTPYAPSLTVISGTTPTPTGVVLKAFFRVVGKTLLIKYMRSGSATATAGVGTYRATLPEGYVMDGSIMVPDTEGLATAQGTDVRLKSIQLGVGSINDGGQSAPVSFHPQDGTHFVFQAADPTGGGHTKLTGSAWFPVSDALSTLYGDMIIPIL